MRRWLWIAAAASFCGLIFYFSQSPHFTSWETIKGVALFVHGSKDDLNLANKIVRKAVHMFNFGVLAVLFRIVLSRINHPYLTAWLGAAAYGIGDEIHQSFIPTRESTPIDVIYDSIGAILGCLIYYGVTRICKNKRLYQ